jgi:uncharacterized protein
MTEDRPKRIEIETGEPERVPAILQIPAGNAMPAVLLLHGFGSDKERLAASMGPKLLRRGVASLAMDLPLHGARAGTFRDLSFEHPLAAVKAWRLALREAASGLRYLAHHDDIDPERIGIAGYSLGAYIGVFAASSAIIRAVLLVAGGDLPELRSVDRIVRAAADPRRAVAKLEGKPLLMINGHGDRTVRPAQATALFEAAREPKEQRWYEGGHWPPERVIDGAADWLANQLHAPRLKRAN